MAWRARLIVIFTVFLVLYLLILAALYTQQRKLIYPGSWNRQTPTSRDPNGFRRVAVQTRDGLMGRIVYHPARDGHPVILFFHGNGGDVSESVAAVRPFVAQGYGAVLPEYRGYGGLPGAPSEQGLYSDARAARQWMMANHIDGNGVILMGYSLGTGVAAQMATEMDARALVLVAPYSSIAHVAAARYPFVPVNALLTERFDTLSKLPKAREPILIVHGADDRTVPPVESAILLRAVPRAERIVIPGQGHGVVYDPAAQARISDWLKTRAR